MKQAAILCVDDESVVLDALRTLFEPHFKETHWIEIAQSAAEALEIVDECKAEDIELEVVISDYIMPGMKGDEFLVRIYEKLPKACKIMLTGQSDFAAVKRVVNEAALYRFIEKPWSNDDLLLTVKGAIRASQQDKQLERQNEELRRLNEELELIVAERTRELIEKNRELERLSITDQLTKLYNRLKLDEVFAAEFYRSERYHSPFSIILLDIDHFKRVNDNHGHPVGDAVLTEIARLLQSVVRNTDIPGRWGGEEFLVICPGTDLHGALELAEKLRKRIETYHFPTVQRITSSFGVTAYQEGDKIQSVVARADAALYRAKQNGRNRVEQNP